MPLRLPLSGLLAPSRCSAAREGLRVSAGRSCPGRSNDRWNRARGIRLTRVSVLYRVFPFEAQSVNVHGDFQRIAPAGHCRQNQNRRHQDSRHRGDLADEGAAPRRHATQPTASADIPQTVLATFGLSARTYTLTQLRYDLRKDESPTACSNASDEATATVSSIGGREPHSCSSCSTSGSAGRRQTRCSVTDPTKPSGQVASLKLPTTRPITPFNTCLTCSPPGDSER